MPNQPPPPLPPSPADADAETALLSGGPERPTKRRRDDGENVIGRLLQRIVKQFPPCRFAAAYGSAVFHQPDTLNTATASPNAPLASITSSPPMLDLLFVVDDPMEFHTANLVAHPSHYSFLKHFGGARTISSVNALPAYLYYNTNVPITTDDEAVEGGGSGQSPQLIKYGVIAVDRVTEDLSHWTTLYTAGRMQKPVRILQPSSVLRPHLAANLSSALTVACYLSPPSSQSGGGVEVSEVELYTLLTSLSYMGDVRMGIAEDPMKIVRIVTGSYSHFHSLYEQPIAHCDWLEDRGHNNRGQRLWRVKDSEADRQRMVDALPSHLSETLAMSGGGSGRRWWEGVGMVEQQARMRAGLAMIVRRSSWQQSTKGVLTAGVRKGLWYGLRKVAKAWK